MQRPKRTKAAIAVTNLSRLASSQLTNTLYVCQPMQMKLRVSLSVGAKHDCTREGCGTYHYLQLMVIYFLHDGVRYRSRKDSPTVADARRLSPHPSPRKANMFAFEVILKSSTTSSANKSPTSMLTYALEAVLYIHTATRAHHAAIHVHMREATMHNSATAATTASRAKSIKFCACMVVDIHIMRMTRKVLSYHELQVRGILKEMAAAIRHWHCCCRLLKHQSTMEMNNVHNQSNASFVIAGTAFNPLPCCATLYVKAMRKQYYTVSGCKSFRALLHVERDMQTYHEIIVHVAPTCVWYLSMQRQEWRL